MKKTYYIVLTSIILIAVLSSCYSPRQHYSKESHFAPSNLEKLNSKYFLERKNLYKFFNIVVLDSESKDYVYLRHRETPNIYAPVSKNEVLHDTDTIGHNFVILNFNGKDTLNVIYRDNDFWYRTSYKGKLKKKYFEISLQNKRYPFFPLFSRHDVDRIRIGQTQTGETAVHNLDEHWGTVLLFGGLILGDESALILRRLEE